MKSKIILLCLCTGLLTTGSAQSLVGATFPFGLQVQPNSGTSLSMGGAGTAVSSEYNLMLRNPANLANLEKTVLTALVSFDFLKESDGSAHTNFISGAPQQIGIGIPLGSYGGIGLSYDQRYNKLLSVNYDTSFAYKNTIAHYSRGLSQSGGAVVWQIGYGYSIPKLLQIGVAYERMYYSAQTRRVESFSYEGSLNNPARDSVKTLCTVNGIRGGVVIPYRKLRIGLTGEYFFLSKAKADSATYYTNYAEADTAVPGTSGSRSFDMRFPPSLTLGLAYDFTPEWLAATDVSFTMWNKAVSESNASNPFTAVNFSLGGQYIPAPNLLAPRYWEIMRYRAGIRYTQLASKEASETMLSLGVGLPIGRGTGLFDVILEAGRRTDSRFANVKEDVIHIGIGFNGGRKWAKSSRNNY